MAALSSGRSLFHFLMYSGTKKLHGPYAMCMIGNPIWCSFDSDQHNYLVISLFTLG